MRRVAWCRQRGDTNLDKNFPFPWQWFRFHSPNSLGSSFGSMVRKYGLIVWKNWIKSSWFNESISNLSFQPFSSFWQSGRAPIVCWWDRIIFAANLYFKMLQSINFRYFLNFGNCIKIQNKRQCEKMKQYNNNKVDETKREFLKHKSEKNYRITKV